ncbi:MAG: hypothetical protein [Caudoviricetes sp.]|nr:MAG: hypothetical protein [Caudoviricetes sp.]
MSRKQSTGDRPQPSPSNLRYIDRDVHEFIVDLLRTTRVSYNSPHHDFIRNEVLEEVRRRFESCVKPR